MKVKLLSVFLPLLIFYNHSVLKAQCTIPSSSCGGYTVQVTITPTSIVPSSFSCGPGYNYNVTFNYSITVSGSNTCYNGNIGIQPQIFCSSQNNGYYTINVPAPTVGVPSTNTYTGTLTTTTNPWRPVSDCASATPTSLGCNSIDITIFGPGISTSTVSCTTPSNTISTGTIVGSPFCAGASVNVPFTATGTFNSGNVFTAQLSNSSGSFASPTNIGTLTSTSSGTISATIPGGAANGSGYRIRVVSSNPSITGSDNGANISINANVSPSVSIASSIGTTICSGASVTFTATPTNGGGSPTYNFRVNGSTVQNTTSNTYTTTSLTNGQTVNVIMTSNATCPSPTTATSSTLNMTVNSNVTPAVSIASNVGTTICSGASVTFTATPTNGGGSPTYNFRVNGSTVQNTTSNTYTTTSLTNGQTVNVIMTSNATCPSPTTATSSTLNMTVNSNVTPAVSIASNVGTTICSGASVTFTATPTNGGGSPTYNFRVNGSTVQNTTSNTYTTTSLTNGQTVNVIMTSNATCPSPTTATSSTLNMTVNTNLVPTITIANSQVNLCTSGISFSSVISNGGSSPSYQWKKNGSNISSETNSTYIATNLINGDLITCELISNATCASPTTVNSNTISVSLTGSTTTWLGLSNDWSVGSPINWSNGYPSSNTTAIIPAGTPNNPQINDIVECFNIEIQSGATLSINGVNQLNIYGKFTNNGTFNAGFGSVEFLSCIGSSVQPHEITSTNGVTSSFFNVNLDDLAGLNLTANASISGTLSLTNGTFNNVGQVFTFISTATGTARIASVGSSANFNGNITMQRYAPGPRTGWAQLGTPIQGATLAQWYDNFPMQGFTGVYGGGSSGFVSVYTYNETIAGLFDANGSYLAATNITNSIPVGKGFWLYLGSAGAGGSSTVNTQPITIDVTGQPYIGGFNFNPTYTNSGNPFDDGFNLVANPYPSAIDWLSPNWTKTNINNAIYMYQADNGQYASFVGGIATNGGSRYIASSQGFYIQTNAANPTLIITENAKSTANPVLIKEEDPSHVLRLKIVGNELSDEMVIHLNNQATNDFDGSFDAKKIFSNDPNNPSISSVCNNRDLAINSLPFSGTTLSIPIRVTVGTSGMYHLNWSGLQGFDQATCIVLEDLDNGIKTIMTKDVVYYFTASAGFKAPRFLVHINTPLPNVVSQASCNNSQDGSIALSNFSNTPCTVVLKDDNGNSIKEAQITSTYIFDKLAIGNYRLTYPMLTECGNMMQIVKISANTDLNANFEVSNQIINTNDEVIFSTQQSKANSITWNFGDGTVITGMSTVSHNYKEAGVYNVSMTCQKGECSVSESILLKVTTVDPAQANEVNLVMQDGVYYAVFNFTENTRGSLRITNNLGQEVCATQELLGKNGKLKLQLEHLSEGIYMVTMSNGKEIKSQKIIK